MSGILITKGVTPGFLPGGIKLFIDENGQNKMDATLSLHYDVVGNWIRISLDSLRSARAAWKTAKERLSINPDDIPIEILEIDFQQSMIAVIGLSISMEAFNSRLSQFNVNPIIKQGNKRSAPRYAQVAEQLKLSFKLDNKLFISIRMALRQLYIMRDQAVHPSGKLSPAVFYSEINRGVEFRFEKFRSKNINAIAQDIINIYHYLANNSLAKNKDIESISNYMKVDLTEIIKCYPDIIVPKK